MNLRDRTLVRKLAVVLVIKLFVLGGLWWVFVREERVAVSPETAATQMLGSSPAPLSKSVQE
jgi:hypothetical protein